MRKPATTTKYFCGDIELHHIRGMLNETFAMKFPSAEGIRYDYYSKMVGFDKTVEPFFMDADHGWNRGPTYPVDRVVQYKSNPSLHACDNRCLNATGRIMKCECSCGGKNHGKGSSTLKCE